MISTQINSLSLEGKGGGKLELCVHESTTEEEIQTVDTRQRDAHTTMIHFGADPGGVLMSSLKVTRS